MAENIGAAARAMKNFGLYDLRLVRPRDGWPNPGALATASHAADLIHAAPVYDSVADAIADLDRVYASTARSRCVWETACRADHRACGCGDRRGLIVGRRWGLMVHRGQVSSGHRLLLGGNASQRCS